MNKSQIRQIYKEKRLKLTAQEVQEKSLMISNNFIKNFLPKIENFANKKLAFYVATNNEVDPSNLIQHFHTLKNVIALPKIASNSLVLDFKIYKFGEKLVPNTIYPTILEPKEANKTILPDIVFVPLVAFDKKCNRIGMGGGFYDATINYFRKQNLNQTFIGLAYECQNTITIPQENLDQKLNYIISENNIISLD